MGLLLILFGFSYVCTVIAATTFHKANYRFVDGLIPIKGTYIWMKIIGKPTYWVVLTYLPVANVFTMTTAFTDLARCFGKDEFKDYLGSLVVPFIYFPLLAKKDVTYLGTVADLEVKPKQSTREWSDAIAFAMIAAAIIRWSTFEAFTIPTPSMEGSLLVGDYLFVSKLHYGARSPITPMQVPLTHQYWWFTADELGRDGVKSYLNWIQLPYFRLPGFTEIKRNDVVVFNYPYDDVHDPVDLKTNYIKRCVAIAGETLEVKNRVLYVNNQPAKVFPEQQTSFEVTTPGPINTNVFRKFGITDIVQVAYDKYIFNTKADKMEKAQGYYSNIMLSYMPEINPLGEKELNIFPKDPQYTWNRDFYGPLTVPKRGMKIEANKNNLTIYHDAITLHEGLGESVRITDDYKLFIDNQEVKEYTFKYDYYFMMGDNRHNSLDSRYWGFVPETHVVGKAALVWMSIGNNPGKSIFKRIRWERLFMTIE